MGIHSPLKVFVVYSSSALFLHYGGTGIEAYPEIFLGKRYEPEMS
jgi:hypothetical protein